jgi:hypothetical protein
MPRKQASVCQCSRGSRRVSTTGASSVAGVASAFARGAGWGQYDDKDEFDFTVIDPQTTWSKVRNQGFGDEDDDDDEEQEGPSPNKYKGRRGEPKDDGEADDDEDQAPPPKKRKEGRGKVETRVEMAQRMNKMTVAQIEADEIAQGAPKRGRDGLYAAGGDMAWVHPNDEIVVQPGKDDDWSEGDERKRSGKKRCGSRARTITNLKDDVTKLSHSTVAKSMHDIHKMQTYRYAGMEKNNPNITSLWVTFDDVVPVTHGAPEGSKRRQVPLWAVMLPKGADKKEMGKKLQLLGKAMEDGGPNPKGRTVWRNAVRTESKDQAEYTLTPNPATFQKVLFTKIKEMEDRKRY